MIELVSYINLVSMLAGRMLRVVYSCWRGMISNLRRLTRRFEKVVPPDTEDVQCFIALTTLTPVSQYTMIRNAGF